jgi:hypothetical protein
MKKPIKTAEQEEEAMRLALAAYSGPVKRCPPGKARAPAEKLVVMNRSVEWLKQNRHARPIRDKKAVRRQMRMACAMQQRIAKRNATLLKRVKRQERDLPRPPTPPVTYLTNVSVMGITPVENNRKQ